MKKVLYLFLFAITILIFPMKSYASTNPAVESLNEICQIFFGNTVGDERLSTICDRWESRGSDYALFMFSEGSGYATFLITDQYSTGNQTGSSSGFPILINVQSSHWDSYIYRFAYNTLSQNLNQYSSVSFGNTPCLFLGDYDSFLIDYNNYQIDYLLPTPDISVYYGNWDLSGYYAPFIFDVDSVYDGNENVYLQALVKYYSPSNIMCDQDGRFKILERTSSNYIALIPFQDKITEAAFASGMDDLDENWRDFDSEVEKTIVGVNPIFEDSETYDYLVTKYNQGSKVLGVYGSVFEVWVRYWYIDSENKVKVGSWWHWNNTITDSFSLDIPASMTYGNPSSGIVSHGLGPLEPSDDNIQYIGTPTGNSNGTGINVTVNPNSVPNTYQYPTVTTFNHDNLLVTWINTAQQLPSMFSGYANFLKEAFVFIPVQVWTIIGFGFLSAIAIMIIKIL